MTKKPKMKLPKFVMSRANVKTQGPFKYYVINKVGGWGQKMATFVYLQYSTSSKRRVGGPKNVKNMMTLYLRNFVIEGVACQPPSNLRRLQATPPLQTSLVILEWSLTLNPTPLSESQRFRMPQKSLFGLQVGRITFHHIFVGSFYLKSLLNT